MNYSVKNSDLKSLIDFVKDIPIGYSGKVQGLILSRTAEFIVFEEKYCILRLYDLESVNDICQEHIFLDTFNDEKIFKKVISFLNLGTDYTTCSFYAFEK